MSDVRARGHERDVHGLRQRGAHSALTDAEGATLRRSRLAKPAAQQLGLSDITAEIRRLSETETADLIRLLRIRSKAPTPAIAQALRTFFARANEEQSVKSLHDGLHYAVISASQVAELDEDDLAALLSARRDELGFLVGQPLRESLTAPEEFGVSAAVRTAAWSSMVCMEHAGSIAALAWLVADPPAAWTDKQRTAVADAWAAVRQRHPLLPERPASIDELCSTVTELELSGSMEKLAVQPAADKQAAADHLADVDDGDENADGERSTPDAKGLREQLADLSERIDAEQSTYTELREVGLPGLLAAMADGLLPPKDEIARLVDLANSMSDLLAEVAHVTEGPVPGTLADAAQQIREMAEAIEAESALGPIRLLSGLVAPDYVANEATAIRERAVAVDAESDPAMISALKAFVDLVRLGSKEPEQSLDLSRIVQSALPDANTLVMLALGGHLRLDPVVSPDTRDEETDTRDEETGSAVGASADVIEADDATPTAPDSPADEPVSMPSAVAAATETVPAEEASPQADLDDVLTGLDFTIPATKPTPVSPAAVPVPEAMAAEAKPKDNSLGISEGDTDIDTAALYVRLMDARQFALASWLADAHELPRAVSAAHRLAAHASAMRSSAGPNAAAFVDELRNLDIEALAPVVGAQMLVYAAAVRAGLMSPAVGAAPPLRDLTPSISKAGSAVEELTEALLVTFYSGAHLTTRSFTAAAEAVEIEAQYASLARAARDLLTTASSRTIRYQAATELWKLWMGPNGYLGAPLAIVAASSRSEDDLRFVRHRVTELRSRSTIEKAISNDGPKVMSTRSNKHIEARARNKIIEWAGDVADLLADWIASVDDIGKATAGGGWMDAPITQLRARVATVRTAALAELEALALSVNGARNAAIHAGIALLADTLDLVSGEAMVHEGTEMSADRIANGLLIFAEGLPVRTVPQLRPLRPVVVADIASAADTLADGAAGWTAAFAGRSENGDHVGTNVIVEMVRDSDPTLARRLSAARERDVANAVSALDGEVAELSTRIDSDRMFERLTYDQWSDLSSRARAYELETRGDRVDFDIMRAALAEVETDREERSLHAVEMAWLRMDGSDLTDDQRRRVSECIERRDLTTAYDYLETIRVKGELPADRKETDHLKQFFPAFPALFSAAGRPDTLLLHLQRAIYARENPAEGTLGEVLDSAGIDLSAIVRNMTAADRVDHWLKLSTARTLNKQASSVKPVLEQLGYIVHETRIPAKAGRSPGGRSGWIYLSGVRVTSGKALIPAFGTKMSPSGDTLRVLAVWGAPTVPEIVEQLRSEPVEHSVIVLYFGTLGVAARNEFAAALHRGRKLPTTIIIDDPMFAYLAAQPTPRRDITISVALPFASAEPFTPDVAGLVPVEMFYGRTEELDQVVNMMGSCIIYGGRQLGKSALLRAAAREFSNGTTKHAIYQSIFRCGQAVPADAVWPTLWPQLAERGIVPEDMPGSDITGAVVRHITAWITADTDRQLLLLLDESDSFLDADAKDGSFPHVSKFKELMETTERAVKVVFAGLHQTARFERLSNHPLAHLGNPVCVGPLTPQSAYDLLTRPLHALGYRFSDDNVAARVLALANNQPALIQLFGAKLLRRLQTTPSAADTPPRIVTAADVEAVWTDETLRAEFRKRFDWTLNLDPRYKIIAYSVAFHAYTHGIESALSPTELRSQCEQWWPKGFASKDVLTGEFRALLDECVALGVLSYNTDGNYRLRTPNVLALLGSRDDVDDVLDQAEAQEPPQSFDGSLLRPAFLNSHTRSPLTSAQISDLLGPGSRVRVIVGSPALTVERCAKVLSNRHENAAYWNTSITVKEATATGLVTACQQVARTTRGIALVLVDLKGARHDVAVTAWEQARDQIAGYSPGTLIVVLLTTPAQAAMWAQCERDADQSSGLTELHRYDSVGLRLWLTETTLPFQDEASRAELLQATGGWPILVNRVVDDLLKGDGAASSDPLESMRQWLAQPANADALVRACGLRADNTLAQAWSFLVTEFGGEAADLDGVAEWLSLAVEDAPSLSDEALGAAGYGSRLEVARILRMLGVLVTSPDDGKLRLEPVVAAATRIAVGEMSGAETAESG
jgi:hypothetical protein